jgi:hypothetical protein
MRAPAPFQRSTSAFSLAGRSIVRVCSLSGTYGSASMISWRRRRTSVTNAFNEVLGGLAASETLEARDDRLGQRDGQPEG